MFAGHFGLAAGVKAKSPETPLWALMLGTQLLDVVFVPLLLTGAETMVSQDGNGNGYGEMIIHADYSHSLLGALLISLVAGLLSRRLWGARAGRVMAAVVFSHWLLDLLVHRTDLPLLPGNFGHLPLLGLGLWKVEWLSVGAELALLAVGFAMYARSVMRDAMGGRRKAALAAGAVIGSLLVFSLLTDVLGLF